MLAHKIISHRDQKMMDTAREAKILFCKIKETINNINDHQKFTQALALMKLSETMERAVIFELTKHNTNCNAKNNALINKIDRQESFSPQTSEETNTLNDQCSKSPSCPTELSSLSDEIVIMTFDKLKEEFMRRNPSLPVNLTNAGSFFSIANSKNTNNVYKSFSINNP